MQLLCSKVEPWIEPTWWLNVLAQSLSHYPLACSSPLFGTQGFKSSRHNLVVAKELALLYVFVLAKQDTLQEATASPLAT